MRTLRNLRNHSHLFCAESTETTQNKAQTNVTESINYPRTEIYWVSWLGDYYRPQRSFGQGYVFTRVCDSVHGGGVCLSACWDTYTTSLGRRHPPGKEAPPHGKEAPLPGRKHPLEGSTPLEGSIPQEGSTPPEVSTPNAFLLDLWIRRFCCRLFWHCYSQWIL